MLVYRVENEKGTGPYIGGALEILWVMREHHSTFYDDPEDDPHPGPSEDGIPWMMADEYSAVQSPEAAQAWFEGYGEVLDEAGFEMTVWDAQDVRCGGKQVVFRKDTARMVASYPIMEYIR